MLLSRRETESIVVGIGPGEVVGSSVWGGLLEDREKRLFNVAVVLLYVLSILIRVMVERHHYLVRVGI
jgi:hypothetical protein